MSNIRLKRSAVPNRIPTIDQVELGELVINSYDGKLFLKKDIDGQQSIVELGASNGGGGSQGTQGTSGVQGIIGSFGSQGTQGISGAFVAQGIQGTTGTQGTNGTNGTNGSQGIQGISGANSSQSIQGTQGTTGIQGTTGTQGTNGSPGITSIVNISELKLRKGTSESVVEVLGYYTVGDGGGGVFYWDDNSVLSDNGGTIFQVSNVTTGRWIRIFDMFINVRWFGAKVDGTTIDNIPINNSILYANSIGGRNVYFPGGTYLIDGTANVPINAYSTYGGIVLKSNVNIICDSGVTFNIKPNTAIGYSCFVGVDISNVSISGGFKIYGDRVGHVLGEFGHGISLFSCKNIKIDSVNIDNVWGDGIYSGLKQNNILNDECENLSITNVVITNYRRNGISITSGKQIYINNVSILTGGGQSVSFSAGIDLEPDYATTTIQNVLIENVYIKTTFNGFSTAATNSFSVDKITILNSYIDAGTATMTGAIDSTIVYNNCVIKGVNYNNHYSTFNDCSFYIDDTYTFSGQSYMFDEASALYNKLIFKNCKFEVKGSKLFFYKNNVSNTGQIVFENCLITIEGLAYADFTSYLNIEGNLLMYNTKFKYIGSKASNYANGYRMGYTFNGIDQIFDNCEIDPILNQNLPQLTGKFSYNLTR